MFQPHVASRDPVRTNPIFGVVLVVAVVATTAFTIYLGDHVIPHSGDGPKEYIIAAIPGFFFLMLVEGLLLKYGAVSDSIGAQYTAADTWSSIAAGTVQQTWLTVFKRFVPLALGYNYIYDNYGMKELFDTTSWTPYIVAFILGDFVYYWFHRHAHEISFLWAGHCVHHSSEHYNLSTALRQSTLQGLVSIIWSFGIAFFIPPSVYLLANQWVTLYQFWVHTCVIRHMGIFEYIFVTPSHHRVHHDRRVHKNFAGVLIIWDRIFGTFHDELDHGVTKDTPQGDETCYFGIKETISTWSEAVTQIMLWEPIIKRMDPWFGPGWASSTAPRPLPSVAPPSVLRIRVVNEVSSLSMVYIYAQYTFCLYSLVVLLVGESALTPQLLFVHGASIAASLTCQGLLFDGSIPFPVLILEILRCVVAVAVSHALKDSVTMMFAGCSLLIAVLFNTQILGNGACAPPKSKTE